MNALRNLGLRRGGPLHRLVRRGSEIRPPKDQTTLEGYIVANYGWRLYRHFFKTYSEKVWGVPASEISADFGAQRIKGMSLWQAVWEPTQAEGSVGRRDKSKQVTSLIEEFNYPNRNPFLVTSLEMPRSQHHSEQTAREIDQEVKRILDEGLQRTRHILETRRAALEAISRQLIKQEVIDATELKRLIEANSSSPMIVPGTEVDGKRRARRRALQAGQGYRRLGNGKSRRGVGYLVV